VLSRCAAKHSPFREAACDRSGRPLCPGRSPTTASRARCAGRCTPTRSIACWQACRRARPDARLFGALDARDLHHHGAGERGPARGHGEGRRPPRPEHQQLYDRRGYNPEKAASFFATLTLYSLMTKSVRRRFAVTCSAGFGTVGCAEAGRPSCPVRTKIGQERAPLGAHITGRIEAPAHALRLRAAGDGAGEPGHKSLSVVLVMEMSGSSGS
jgi:hypothetical protein